MGRLFGINRATLHWGVSQNDFQTIVFEPQSFTEIAQCGYAAGAPLLRSGSAPKLLQKVGCADL